MLPALQRVLMDAEDYERGSLGPIGRLPAHLVDAYRAVTYARREWQERMTEAMSDVD